MSTFYTVAVYITAYEDATALNECLAAIAVQSYPISHILVVDNSSQPLPLNLPLGERDITVWHHPENIGIAGGLDLALPWAAAQGYDFLWTFDQDSVPTRDCLQLLLAAYVERATATYEIGLVAPLALDARTGDVVQPSRFLGDRFRGYVLPDRVNPCECDAPITSGSLVWLKTLQQVPPPNPALFMDGIDLEYGWRLRLAGFHNLVVPTALMYHRFGLPLQVKIGDRQKAFQLYSPLRYYYICRNQTYIELLYARGWYRLTCCLWRCRYLLMALIIIVLFDAGQRGAKMAACWCGTYDGFAGKLGKTWN